VNGILYVLRSGCPWRLLPLDFPAWGTIYHYFRQWQRDGVWDQILIARLLQMRTRQGRNPEPSAAVIDSQSIKTSPVRGEDEGVRPGKKSVGAISPSDKQAEMVGSESSNHVIDCARSSEEKEACVEREELHENRQALSPDQPTHLSARSGNLSCVFPAASAHLYFVPTNDCHVYTRLAYQPLRLSLP
jgi:transposase